MRMSANILGAPLTIWILIYNQYKPKQYRENPKRKNNNAAFRASSLNAKENKTETLSSPKNLYPKGSKPIRYASDKMKEMNNNLIPGK